MHTHSLRTGTTYKKHRIEAVLVYGKGYYRVPSRPHVGFKAGLPLRTLR